MKIFSQNEWWSILPSQLNSEVSDVIGTRSNPSENDVQQNDTPEDAVCISEEIIADLRSRADWLWQDDQEELGNSLAAFANLLEERTPSRSLVVADLVSEGRA